LKREDVGDRVSRRGVLAHKGRAPYFLAFGTHRGERGNILTLWAEEGRLNKALRGRNNPLELV